MNVKLLFVILTYFVAFFPAYLGYDFRYQWIGLLITMIFWLSSFIPFVHDFGKRGLLVVFVLAIFAYAIESLWVLTCIPYGCFTYSELLGPKLLGIVPWLLLFTRPPLVIGVWSWIKKYSIFWYLSWIVGGLALVVIDLILDPIAVLMGLWHYPWWGRRFGVPLNNFIWWFLSGTMGIMMVDLLLKKRNIARLYDMAIWLFIAFFVGYLCFSYIQL